MTWVSHLTGVWRLEEVLESHCWGQKCYVFSNDDDPLGMRWHVMAVTFWKGWMLPRGFSGNPGVCFPPETGWPKTRTT